MTSKGPKLIATVVSGHTFTVDTRYELKDSKILGRGSYGVVTTATDRLQHGKIAIKRIRPFANDEWDARHTLREIRLLKLLGPHPNVSWLGRKRIFSRNENTLLHSRVMFHSESITPADNHPLRLESI
jgi:serine/threonine protein kinase